MVKNVPSSLRSEDVRKAFESAGRIKECTRDKRGEFQFELFPEEMNFIVTVEVLRAALWPLCVKCRSFQIYRHIHHLVLRPAGCQGRHRALRLRHA